MNEMQNTELYKKNLSALSPFIAPGLLKFLTTSNDCDIEIVYRKESQFDPLNIKVAGEDFYATSAQNFARDQLDNYKKNIQRFYYDDGAWDFFGHTNVVPRNSSEHLLKAIASEVSPFQLQSKRNALPAGFGVMFGLGLGAHVEEFVSEYNFINLIICDGYVDFLQASMQAVDWAPTVKMLDERGGRLFFCIDDNAQNVNLAVSSILKTTQVGLIEGTYLYQHHAFGPVPEMVNRFSESYSQLISYNGWLGDELVHLRSITGNISRWGEMPLLNKGLDFLITKPVLVLGSGPSLQQNLEHIKSIRDDIVIISSGSSLRIILTAGITPDFHCELENVALLADIFETLSKEFDLSGISLLASFTVDPKVPEYFKDVLFLPREGGGFTRIIRQNVDEIPHSGRTATLMAIAVAMYWRCQSIYLFGLDFAVSESGDTHAPNSIYSFDIKGLKKGSGQGEHKIQVPGNFQPAVWTSELWVFMRQGVEIALASLKDEAGTQVYNCSGGARIEGAKPCKVAHLIETVAAKPNAENSIQSIHDFYHGQKIGELLSQINLQQYIDASYRMLKKFSLLKNEIHDASHSVSPVMALNKLLESYSQNDPSSAPFQSDNSIFALLSGELLRSFHFIRFKAIRVSAVELAEFERAAVDIFCEMTQHIILHLIVILKKTAHQLGGDVSLEHSEIFPADKVWLELYSAMGERAANFPDLIARAPKLNAPYLFLQSQWTRQDHHSSIPFVGWVEKAVPQIEKGSLFDVDCPICHGEDPKPMPTETNHVLNLNYYCQSCDHHFNVLPQAEKLYFNRTLHYKKCEEPDLYHDQKQFLVKEGLNHFPDATMARLVEFDALDFSFITGDAIQFGYEECCVMQVHPELRRRAEAEGIKDLDSLRYFQAEPKAAPLEQEVISAILIADTLSSLARPAEFLDQIADRLEENGMLYGIIPDPLHIFSRQIQHYTEKSIFKLLSRRFKDIQLGSFAPIRLEPETIKTGYGLLATGEELRSSYFFCVKK